nr:GNAT family N-acetyltransferase [uncultured Psychroserpens sp.]
MEIRNYKKGDEKDILELFENSFGKTLSIDYWNWRFLQNPFEDKKYINLMWDNDLLVGHYAVSPVQMLIEGEIKKTCLSMTTMTHSDYFGRGIFSKLADDLYNKLELDHYEMVWGFPNTNSHYGFKKNLNWEDIDIIPMMNLNKTRIQQFNNNVEYEIINQVNADIVTALDSKESVVHINKTKDYLTWRYIDNPEAHYKMLSINNCKDGIVIYKKIPSFNHENEFEIDIMELNFGNDFDNLKKIISAIILEEKQDVFQINIWKNLHDYNQIFFEKLGFIYSKPLTFLGYKSFTNNLSPSSIKNWDISFGYSDVY